MKFATLFAILMAVVMTAQCVTAAPTGGSEVELKAHEMDKLDNMNVELDETDRLAERDDENEMDDEVLPELADRSYRHGHGYRGYGYRGYGYRRHGYYRRGGYHGGYHGKRYRGYGYRKHW